MTEIQRLLSETIDDLNIREKRDNRPRFSISFIRKHPGLFIAMYAAWFATLAVMCVFRSIRSRIGIEVRSAIRIHSINRELNFFYRFLTRFFAAFHYRGIFPQ